MTTYKTPGVYVEEISTLPPSVAEVSTAIPAFIGCTVDGPTPDDSGKIEPVVARISTLLEYTTLFGGAPNSTFTGSTDTKNGVEEVKAVTRNDADYEYLMYYSLSLYFNNGGGSCYVVSIGNYDAAPEKKHFLAGLEELEKEDEPTLILLTDATGLAVDDYYALCQQALIQCNDLGDRFAILDVLDGDVAAFRDKIGSENLKYGAAYHPYLRTTLNYQYQDEDVILDTGTMASIKSGKTSLYNQLKTAMSQQRVILPPSSAVAGAYATVDRNRGVWKAPANVSLASVIGPISKITHAQQENLNVDPSAGKSINAIRAFSGKGTLIWGARTLAGNDNEWRYVSVRRLFNMIEESVQKSTAFAVFEPNDATTWLKVKAMIEAYLYGLWQQGALAGSTPEAAYFVNVGLGNTMTPQDVLDGRMIIEIGIAAVRPAEFIILRFSHKMQEA
jgi:phage tail sheath protein FI